jgi:hypothetical protein
MENTLSLGQKNYDTFLDFCHHVLKNNHLNENENAVIKFIVLRSMNRRNPLIHDAYQKAKEYERVNRILSMLVKDKENHSEAELNLYLSKRRVLRSWFFQQVEAKAKVI